MSEPAEDPRQQIVDFIDSLYQDYRQGSLKLFRASLAADAVLLGPGDPRVLKGRDRCLDYLRAANKRARPRQLKTVTEDVKLLGEAAVLVQTYTSEVEIEGHDYQEVGRVTTVLAQRGGRWHLTHVHMETLARNPILV